MKASEYKCRECGAHAVAFYPCVDPDIPSYPYCPDCLAKAMVDMAKKVWPNDKGMQALAQYKAKQVLKKYKDND